MSCVSKLSASSFFIPENDESKGSRAFRHPVSRSQACWAASCEIQNRATPPTSLPTFGTTSSRRYLTTWLHPPKMNSIGAC